MLQTEKVKGENHGSTYCQYGTKDPESNIGH
jgi:hypothetical protein